MENRCRNESAKPTLARKKKSVELHLVRRRALADKNRISAEASLQNSAAFNRKENQDQQVATQQNILALKVRNSNVDLPKAASLPGLLAAPRKKLQNLNLAIIAEDENSQNAAVIDKANELYARSKVSELARLEKENEANENSLSITSLKKNQQAESAYSINNRSEQGKKSKRICNVWENLESLLYVEDYKKDIVQYLEKREKELCLQDVPKCSQFAKLHAVIVNWLTKLLSDLDLEDELLFITITLLDRLYTKIYIPVHKLQLAAMACLWIAIKQNTAANILASELISTCKVTASASELIKMEFILLTQLKFNITVIEPLLFVNYYLSEMKIRERRIKQTCRYLLDIILLNSEYSTMYPSLIGSAAVYAALSICGKQTVWDLMQQHTEFHALCQFSHISHAMLSGLKMICLDQAKFRAAYSKHRKVKNGKISKRLVVKQNEIFLL